MYVFPLFGSYFESRKLLLKFVRIQTTVNILNVVSCKRLHQIMTTNWYNISSILHVYEIVAMRQKKIYIRSTLCMFDMCAIGVNELPSFAYMFCYKKKMHLNILCVQQQHTYTHSIHCNARVEMSKCAFVGRKSADVQSSENHISCRIQKKSNSEKCNRKIDGKICAKHIG